LTRPRVSMRYALELVAGAEGEEDEV